MGPNPIVCYRASGAWQGKVFAILPVGMLIAAVAGALYQFIVFVNPLIYINILVSFGAAFIIGFGARLVLQLGNCRSIAIGALVSALVGFAAVGTSHYVAYRTYLYEVSNVVHSKMLKMPTARDLSPEAGAALNEILAPTISNYVKMRVDIGWDISVKGSSGQSLQGKWVYLAWLLELGLFLVLPILVGIGSATEPFCEKCQVWADHQVDIGRYPITDEQFLRDLRSARSVDELLKLPPVDPIKSIASRLALFYSISVCPGCEKSAFLRIAAESKKFDREGTEKIAEKNLIEHVQLSAAELERLLSIHRPDLSR